MRVRGWFWAVVLILIGLLFLLQNLNIISSAWGWFWPLLVIVLGVGLLLGSLSSHRSVAAEEGSVSLDGAARAEVRVHHGAGRLQIVGGAQADKLVSGRFGGGLDAHSRMRGDRLEVDMRANPNWWGGWAWPHGGLDWRFGLNGEVPLELRLETGASESTIDLTDTKTTRIEVNTGASSTQLTLPANAGQTWVRVHLGAASLDMRVPEGVAARIRFQGGLASINVDRSRFPKAGGEYRSPNYDTAANKADISIEAGVGSVQVR